MPIIQFTEDDMAFGATLDDWRHDRISRREAAQKLRDSTGWSPAMIEELLDEQWLPPDRR